MTDPRPPMRPRDDDWPETRDYHREQAEENARLREALRMALEALEPFAKITAVIEETDSGNLYEWAMDCDDLLQARAAIAKIKEALAADAIETLLRERDAAIARAEKAEEELSSYDTDGPTLHAAYRATREERDALRALLREAREDLHGINMMACYASEEDINSREEMLLKIGEDARATLARIDAFRNQHQQKGK